jgi:hypothetical protein
MIRKIIKLVLIFGVSILGLLIYTFIAQIFIVADAKEYMVFPLAVVFIGMVAALKAIWKYKPSSTEITLNKDD